MQDNSLDFMSKTAVHLYRGPGYKGPCRREPGKTCGYACRYKVNFRSYSIAYHQK